ncbi:MAG: hypothetical protein AAB847_00295, partial [Patescibacteria group bacterium]
MVAVFCRAGRKFFRWKKIILFPYGIADWVATRCYNKKVTTRFLVHLFIISFLLNFVWEVSQMI